MQHVFEFLIKAKDIIIEEPASVQIGETLVHRFYVTESSRKSKVSKKLLKELREKQGFTLTEDCELFIRQIR